MKRLVLDIETVPITNEELTAEESKKAALDALTGRIVCIGGIITDDFKARSAVVLVSRDEKKLLRSFWSMLEREQIKSFVTYNGLGFDLPYIWRRSVVQQVRPSIQFDLRRYRNDFVYDTMCVWGNWESRGNVSLNSLAGGLGLGAKSGSGDQVLQLWRDRKQAEIADYCLQDCWLTYEAYCRMNFTVETERWRASTTIQMDTKEEAEEVEAEAIEIVESLVV